MWSPCCRVCVSLPSTFECLNQSLWNSFGMRPEDEEEGDKNNKPQQQLRHSALRVKFLPQKANFCPPSPAEFPQLAWGQVSSKHSSTGWHGSVASCQYTGPWGFQFTLDKEGPEGGAEEVKNECGINGRTRRGGRRTIFIEVERE